METQKGTITAGALSKLMEEIRGVYASDDRPWVIGYSGGKDSSDLPPELGQRNLESHRVFFSV